MLDSVLIFFKNHVKWLPLLSKLPSWMKRSWNWIAELVSRNVNSDAGLRLHQPWFVGRVYERNIFSEFLRNDVVTLSFCGHSGFGKTALINHLQSDSQLLKSYLVVCIDCKETGTDLMLFMQRIATIIGKKNLSNFEKRRKEYERYTSAVPWKQHWIDDLFIEFQKDIEDICRRNNILIFMDSFERVRDKILEDKVRTMLSDYYNKRGGNRFKLVIATQVPIQNTSAWINFQESEVKSFNREELMALSDKYFGTKDQDVIDYFVNEYKGDPLELGWLVRCYRKSYPATIAAQIVQLRSLRQECRISADGEFINKLETSVGPDVMDLLYLCSVPRWFDAIIIRAMLNLSVEKSNSELDKLVRSCPSFVMPRASGVGWEIHERYRAPIIRRLVQKDIERFVMYNRKCYEYIQAKLQNEDYANISLEVEALYHEIIVDEVTAMNHYNYLRYSLASCRRMDLLEIVQGLVEEQLNILYIFCKNENFIDWSAYGRAVINYMKGDLEKAKNIYNVLEVKSGLDAFLLARVLRAKGDLLWSKEENVLEARRYYNNAIEKWEKLRVVGSMLPGISKDDILSSIAETHRALARLNEVQGNLDEGMGHFSSALAIYGSCGSLGPSMEETLRMMGRNQRFQGKWTEAHQYLYMAENSLEDLLTKARVGDAQLTIQMEENLDKRQEVINARAALWKEEGRWEDAKIALCKVVSFHKSKPEIIRNMEALGIALIDQGDVLRMLGELKNGEDAYMEAIDVLKKARSEINRGYPLLGLAEISAAKGNWANAEAFLNDAEMAFMKFGYLRKLAEVGLCRAKIRRATNCREALVCLEGTWQDIRDTAYNYVKSAVLTELSDLTFEMEGNTEIYKLYRLQAGALAESGKFAEHMAKLHFLDGRVAGEVNLANALPFFVSALGWATRHHVLTLQGSLEKTLAWLDAHIAILSRITHEGEKILHRNGIDNLIDVEVDVLTNLLSSLPDELIVKFNTAVSQVRNKVVFSLSQ